MVSFLHILPVTTTKPVLNAKVNGGLAIRHSNRGRRGHGNTLPRSQREQNGDGRRYKKKLEELLAQKTD